MTFEVPESYQAYCTDAAVRTAVDHLLGSSPLRLPADIQWKDLPSFHRAVLSAHQVRCDYATFLSGIWDAVWKPALENCDFGVNPDPLTVAESQAWCGQNIDTYAIWDNGWFGRAFRLADTGYSFGLGVWGDCDLIMLSIIYYDANGDVVQLGLGDRWPEADVEDGIAYSSRGLAQIRDGCIDLASLGTAAADALAAITVHRRD